MILVTGATGNNGSEIVKQLVAAGAPVRALVRNPEKAAAMLPSGVEIVQGDLNDIASLDVALQGIDRAMLVSSYAENQVELQGNLIKAAQQTDGPHIVKFSVLGADPDGFGSVLRWHGQTEKELEASGLPYTHLRPNSFMQNLLMFAQGISSQGAFSLPAGDTKISFVDIRDVAAVAVKLLTETGHEGKAYEVTGPEALSYGDCAAKLSEAIGKPVQYVAVSPAEFKQGMMGWGLPEWMVDGMNDLYTSYATGYASAVTDTTHQVTGQPSRSFDQFAKDHAAVFQS